MIYLYKQNEQHSWRLLSYLGVGLFFVNAFSVFSVQIISLNIILSAQLCRKQTKDNQIRRSVCFFFYFSFEQFRSFPTECETITCSILLILFTLRIMLVICNTALSNSLSVRLYEFDFLVYCTLLQFKGDYT